MSYSHNRRKKNIKRFKDGKGILEFEFIRHIWKPRRTITIRPCFWLNIIIFAAAVYWGVYVVDAFRCGAFPK